VFITPVPNLSNDCICSGDSRPMEPRTRITSTITISPPIAYGNM